MRDPASTILPRTVSEYMIGSMAAISTSAAVSTAGGGGGVAAGGCDPVDEGGPIGAMGRNHAFDIGGTSVDGGSGGVHSISVDSGSPFSGAAAAAVQASAAGGAEGGEGTNGISEGPASGSTDMAGKKETAGAAVMAAAAGAGRQYELNDATHGARKVLPGTAPADSLAAAGGTKAGFNSDRRAHNTVAMAAMTAAAVAGEVPRTERESMPLAVVYPPSHLPTDSLAGTCGSPSRSQSFGVATAAAASAAEYRHHRGREASGETVGTGVGNGKSSSHRKLNDSKVNH